jgi:hypothetical protein
VCRRSAVVSLRRLLVCDCFICLLSLRSLFRLCCLHSRTATASTVVPVMFRSSRVLCCIVGCIMRRFVFLFGPLKMETLRFLERSETVRPVAQRHNLQDRCRGLCLDLQIVNGYEWAVLAQCGMWCGDVSEETPAIYQIYQSYGRSSLYLISLCSAILISHYDSYCTVTAVLS